MDPSAGPVQPYVPDDVAQEKAVLPVLAGTTPWLKIDLLTHPEWKSVPASPGAGEIAGELPTGLEDNSSWAKVRLHYARAEEEGRPFLQWNIDEIKEGRAQITASLPQLDQAYFLRIHLKARALKALPLTIGVRQYGPPYQFMWSRDISLDSKWSDLALDGLVQPCRQPVKFFLISGAPNRIELSAVSIDAIPLSVLQKQSAAETALPPVNLLRSSRFPLGLPAGANPDRATSEGDDLMLETDPTRPGAGGWATLKLTNLRTKVHPSVVFEPFAVDTILSPYTASVAAAGTGGVSLRLIENGVTIASQTFQLDPTAAWRRLALTSDKFKPGFPYQLEIASWGTTWIDAMQVTPGKTDPGYLSADRPEIALAATPLSRVYLEGEKAVVHYQVTGKTDGLKLRVKVVDVYHEQRVFADILLTTTSLQGDVPFDIFPNHPFGAFRIEARIVDAGGKTASAGFETTVLRVRSPRHLTEDAPDSPFGVHVMASRSHLEMAKRIGLNWVRLHDAGLEYIGWNFLETLPGKWQFRDAEINRYRKNHLMILGEAGTAPAWASNLSKFGPHDPYFDRFYQPNNLEDFAAYAHVVGLRYQNQITYWDVWNEPWNHPWWAVSYNPQLSGEAAYQTSEHPQRDFANLTKTAFTTMKAINTSEQVGGIASTTGDPAAYAFGGTEWTRGVMEAGGINSADMITYHDYFSGTSLYPQDPVEAGLHTALGPLLDSAGKAPRPIWMTEGSPVPGVMKTGFYHYSLPLPLPEDFDNTGDLVCRYVTSLLVQGVQKVFLYSMHGYGYMEMAPQWSILTVQDGSPHPSGAAFANMAYWLEDTKFQERVSLSDSVGGYIFAGKSHTVIVFAMRQGEAGSYTLPAHDGMQYYDLYGNPLVAGTSVPTTLVYGVTAEAPAALHDFLSGH
jgi:hypothetical protein